MGGEFYVDLVRGDQIQIVLTSDKSLDTITIMYLTTSIEEV